jgi:hypothetical protein
MKVKNPKRKAMPQAFQRQQAIGFRQNFDLRL